MALREQLVPRVHSVASERLVLHAESASTEQVVHLARAQPVLRVLRVR